MPAARILPPYETLRELYLAGETPHEIASKYRVGVRAVRHAVARGALQSGVSAPPEVKHSRATRPRDESLVNKALGKGEVVDFMRGYGFDIPGFIELSGIDLPEVERIMDDDTVFVPRSLVVRIVNFVMAYEAVHGEPIDYYAEAAA